MYDYNGNVFKIGNGDMKYKLEPLYKKIDMLKSLKTKSKGNTKYNINKRIYKIIYKIKNKILDIHNKSAYFLTTNYKTVLIPHLVDKGLILKMYSCCRRNILTWSHSKFLERLKFQGLKRNCNIQIVTEEFTSKTCSHCGSINYTLHNKDIFKCQKCSCIIDRDINGARNILLKNLK